MTTCTYDANRDNHPYRILKYAPDLTKIVKKFLMQLHLYYFFSIANCAASTFIDNKMDKI